MYVIPDNKRSILADLLNGSDRVTAIVGCAFIEETLRKRLKSLYGHDKEAFDDVFGHAGPIGSLAHQCRFAYTAKVISRITRNKIETIGSIRNKFAHKSENLTFDHSSLKPLIEKLGKPRSYMLGIGTHSKGSYKIDGFSPRDYFLTNLQDVTTYLDADGLNAPMTRRGVLIIASRGKSTGRPSSPTRKPD